MFCAFLIAVGALTYPKYQFVNTSVFDRDVVTTKMKPDLLLRESVRVFENVSSSRYIPQHKEVLTFITPWNSDGYQLSLEFGAKFSVIVPVWFQFVKKDGKYIIQGFDVVKDDWVKEMHEKHPHIKILPRVNFELPPEDVAFSERKVGSALKQEIKNIIEAHNFDGVFLEFPGYLRDIRVMRSVLYIVKELKKGLPRTHKIFADVPSEDKFHYGIRTDKGDVIKDLINTLDCAFISLYELPMEHSLSPVHALTNLAKWCREVGVIKRVMIGLPLFGFDFSATGVQHVFGNDVLVDVKEHETQIAWVDRVLEHAFFFTEGGTQHVVYYPTPKFLHDRFERAVKEGFAGFGFWELAQGMPYFFDLL